MQTRTRTVAGLAGIVLIACLVTLVSCEDSGITAPEGSTITLIAQPANISIDQDAGDTAGSTLLRAQLLDSSGLPQQDVPLSFTTTGGVLASISNVCVNVDGTPGSNCLRSGDVCLVDSDCPIVPPIVQETDINGIVTDILVLRLFQDPESVEVTVQSTASSSMISVGTNINTGPMDPQAMLTVQPANGSRTGSPVTFDGSASTFELTSPITCFEFDINSSIDTNDEVFRSLDPTLTRNYGTTGSRDGEQDLTVTLRVSDDQNTICDAISAPEFSQFQAVISYQVRCDFEGDLTVNGGPNKADSLDGQPSVTVVLNASAFDVNNSFLTYTWDCGNGDVLDGQNVNCVYTASQQQPYQARVSVENSCGRIVTDSVLVTISQ